MSFIKDAFGEGAFIRRFILLWAMLLATAVMFFVCKLAWEYASPENLNILLSILIAPVTALVAFLSGSYNKWGSGKND